LENIALVYYSNMVNSRLARITDASYDNGIKTLSDLVLCTIATGQGTHVMRRLALSLKEELENDADLSKVDAQNFVGEIDEELVSYIYNLSQELRDVLVASWSHRPTDEMARLHTQLLNDMIREKTTHLSGNLLSGMVRFLGGAGNEATRKLARSNRRSLRGLDEKLIDLKDMVFQFGSDIEDLPPIEEKDWFMGGKGASEVAMSRIVVEHGLKDVDVPKGFGLSTQTWRLIKGSPKRQKELENVIRREVGALEKICGKRLGNPADPLILAARSGAVLSMPGVLPTITHIGLNDEITREWAETLAQPHRAYRAYLRFLFSYAEAVYVGKSIERESLYRGLGAKRVQELCAADTQAMSRTIDAVKLNLEVHGKGASIPDDVYKQLFNSVLAVFSFYETDEVRLHYKGLKSIPEEYQTACLIQDCLPVLADDDCSGIFLTRNPLDGGEGHIEYIRDFGEDLASGRVRPGSSEKFKADYPSQSARLIEVAQILEREYASPMDIEFAVRAGRIYILQTRPLKLAPMADVVTNYKFWERGLMTAEELIERTRRIVGQPLMNTFLEEIHKQDNVPIAVGQPIAGGVVSGRIIFNLKKIESYPDERIIFITKSNVPREVTTRPWIDGYISEEGGVTSHASLVSIGKLPCIVGVHWRRVGESIVLGDEVYIKEGEIITLDANDGYIYKGALTIRSSPENNPEYLEAEAAILNLIKKREEYTLAPRPVGERQ
jgi:pyruvate,orthophosphate dikinase